jgi:hypothetical protein
VEHSPANQDEYVQQVLDAYRKTPGTMGTVRRPDRLLAAQLHQRGVPLRRSKMPWSWRWPGA